MLAGAVIQAWLPAIGGALIGLALPVCFAVTLIFISRRL
jgi:hypothetical protein